MEIIILWCGRIASSSAKNAKTKKQSGHLSFFLNSKSIVTPQQACTKGKLQCYNAQVTMFSPSEREENPASSSIPATL